MPAVGAMINAFDPACAPDLTEAERQLIGRRQAVLGPAYKLFYAHPVHIVRGEGVWLYDPDGTPYLDAYNNVPSVGHGHPRVVEAIARQAATLNTHTRYLHEGIVRYSEQLLATYPDAISHVMYTCTGSEAVDLALRLARWHTRGVGFIVTRNAYHGVTSAAVEISPSMGPDVPLGRQVWTVPAPDPYRAAEGEEAGATLARHVSSAIADMRRHGVPFAGLIADMILSTDGIVAEPKGFFCQAAAVVREAGGLVIADEVQPGFGRTGEGMWGFQRHGIVPDLAVMGKPMGNGMPIAGVAMRPDIIAAFGQAVRYFNTFGANTVSIAAAQAVLDIIRDERLIEHSATVGAYLRAGLSRIAATDARLGDVRGAGLFIGAELVTDPVSKQPDGPLALKVVNRLREKHVLISAAGPFGNVLKIRPPLPFTTAHADLFLDRLDETLRELA